MPRIEHQSAHRGERRSVVVFIEGDHPRTATQGQWSFERIEKLAERLANKTKAADNGRGEYPTAHEAEDLRALFSPEEAANRRFQALGSDRVTVKGGIVHIDGDPVDNSLADQIIRFIDEDLPFDPLVKFYEKLLSNHDPRNPEASEHSRAQLFRFLATNNFAITPDGDILMYKYVNSSVDEDGVETFYSLHAGDAIVNGTPWNGIEQTRQVIDPETGEVTEETYYTPAPVPQRIGDVVSMPRSEVDHDPNRTCSRGLHVASYEYMSHGHIVIECLVDPRFVVSVPTDYNNQKVRVCQYMILRKSDGSEREGALILPTPETPVPDEPINGPTFEDEGVTYYNTSNLGGEGFQDEAPVYETPAPKETTVSRLRNFLGLKPRN